MSARKRRALPINRRFYSLVMRLAVPVLLLRLLWRSRQHSGYRSQIWHRLGFYGRHLASRSGERVWIHAMSVGETLAIALLLERLLAEQPHLSVLVTSTTLTGAEQVQQIGWPRLSGAGRLSIPLGRSGAFSNTGTPPWAHWSKPKSGRIYSRMLLPEAYPWSCSMRGCPRNQQQATPLSPGEPGKRWLILQWLPRKPNRTRVGYVRWVPPMGPS